MDPSTSDVKTRVKLFETSTAVPGSQQTVPPTPPRSAGQKQQLSARRPAPLRKPLPGKQTSTITNDVRSRQASPVRQSSPERQLSPTKKVLSLNGPVSKRYYDIKARRNLLRGVSSNAKDASSSSGPESRSDSEDQRPRKVIASVPSNSTDGTSRIRNTKPPSPSGAGSTAMHRVWSESQQQEDHQTLERRVGVEDGAGWFSPEVHSTSSSDQTDSRPGPASKSPTIRDPTPSTYQSKVARLRTLRSRSPYFIAHQDRELKRNLEAASVILNEEKESSVGSGSTSTRSSLSQEEVRNVAERALKLAKVRQDSRARLIRSSPLHQMLNEKRQPKVSANELAKHATSTQGGAQHPFHALQQSSASDTPSTSSSKPARLTRSERFAMVKGRPRYEKPAPPSDEDSLDISRTTDESKVRESKDLYPMFGYSQRFLARTRQAGVDRRPFDDSSTITSGSPVTTETQTLSSGDTDDKPIRSDRFSCGASVLNRRPLPSKGSFPPPSIPVKTRSPITSQSTSSSENTSIPPHGSSSGSDFTNRAVNRSLVSRTQRAKALKEVLRRQEIANNECFPAEAKPDPIGVTAPSSPVAANFSKDAGFDEAREQTVTKATGQPDEPLSRNDDAEFFDRLCKTDVPPVRTSESETDSGEEPFFGTSTSSSADAVKQCAEPPEGASSSMDTTTLDGEGILNVTSSLEGSRYSLQKQPGQLQHHTPPPPPPPPPLMYFERKSDSSYDTSSESDSPDEMLVSPAKSAFTNGTSADAMRWWAKNYGQFSPDQDEEVIHRKKVEPLHHTQPLSPQKVQSKSLPERSPKRDVSPTPIIRTTLDDDDEDVFSGLEEDKRDGDLSISGEDSDGIPEPNPHNISPVQATTSPTATTPARPRPSPLKPILVQKAYDHPVKTPPRSGDQGSGIDMEPKPLSVKSDVTASVLTGKTKKAPGWFRKRVDTIEEDLSEEDEQPCDKPVPPRRPVSVKEDLLDDSVMVASMSISKATGNKDGVQAHSQQADHAALMSLGYSLVESISAFCKIPKRPLLHATTCVEKSQQSCREIEEGSSMAQTYMGEGEGTTSMSQTYMGDEQSYTFRNHDNALRQRDPEIWAMLEARERAHHLSSGAHGDFEETLTPPDGGASYDSTDRIVAHQQRQLEARNELLEMANQAMSLYGGCAKGTAPTDAVASDLNILALAPEPSKSRTVKPKIQLPEKSNAVGKDDQSEAISARVGIFSTVMKNEGIEVLKLGRRNKWQVRYLTVTSEVMNFNNRGGNAASSGRETQCPLGLLWLKQRSDMSQHGLSNLKKQGRGGLPFSSLRKIESVKGENAPEAVESLNKISKKLRVLFPTLHGVSIAYSFITDDGTFEQRSVIFCFKTDKDAESFATAMGTIQTIVSRGLDASRGMDP